LTPVYLASALSPDQMNRQPEKQTFSPPFDLVCERLGPLRLVNHFIEQCGVEDILERFVPTRDGRCRLPYAKGLGVLIRSIIVEREPIYGHQDVVNGFAPVLFGISALICRRCHKKQEIQGLPMNLWVGVRVYGQMN